jgi:ligand-binding SRPBCC domain-containing protein
VSSNDYHEGWMRFVFEHLCPQPLDVVFGFYSNPANLSVLHGPRPEFCLLRHDGRVTIGAQTWVKMNLLRCIPVVMGFRHTYCEPPSRFGEEIIHGPFKRFVHLHEFETRIGGTLVRDALEIELPWHYGGAVVMRAFVAPLVHRIFAMRAHMLDRLTAKGTLTQIPHEVSTRTG